MFSSTHTCTGYICDIKQVYYVPIYKWSINLSVIPQLYLFWQDGLSLSQSQYGSFSVRNDKLHCKDTVNGSISKLEQAIKYTEVNSLLLEMTPLYFKKLVKSIAKRLEAAIEAEQCFLKIYFNVNIYRQKRIF